jgi:hypothetical protein
MHETSPPPNPFESPQAIDPPNAGEKWRPRWRDLLIGLVVASLVMLLPLFLSQYSNGENLATDFFPLLGIVYAGVIGILPIVALLRYFAALTPRTPIYSWPLLALGSSAFPTVQEGIRFGLYCLILSSMLFFPPCIGFAAWLDYLRRRDLRRDPTAPE